MAGNLITSLVSLATNLLPSITASAQSTSSSSSGQKGHASSVEEDMERLKWIKATLYDAEEREIRDLSVKVWLKELKKVAYAMEDVLSEYRYEVTRVHVEARNASEATSTHKGTQMESIKNIVPVPDDMVDRLKKIRSRLDDIAKDREALQLRETDGVRRPNNKIVRPPTGHMVDEASIFGREAEIKEVIDLLLYEKEKSFSVISIVGKGGLGKTTIAQLVYKDQKVSQWFDLLGWICVSEEFDVKRLTKATIESVSKINSGVSEMSPLQEELAKIVKDKLILLILDDVWNENQSLWEVFWVPFKEAKLVRILVTTRNNKVAKVMQTTTVFRPSNLLESSCWQLFQHYAFSGTNDTVPTHLVDMGREIMRKCGGLPLAVKSIASLLRQETDQESWIEILQSYLWESNSSNDIFPALQISYAHLPAHLKPCFLFCSMYPKDYLLEKMNLIELWISHGYVQSKGKRRITEIGVEYFDELKQRSFLDDFSDESSEYYKLHDIIHDLARLNSENEHYSVEINRLLNIQEGNVLQEAYHLYAKGFMKYLYQILQQNLKGLRTLSLDLVGHTKELKGILTKFESLRVLKLEGNFNKIPDFISELKHLTHLDITSSRLKMLPLSIGLLYNLQTLILFCDSLEYLPESIGDLANLQYLNIQSSKIKKLPNSLCLLSNLLRLVIITDQLEEVPLDLSNLTNLHKLTILSNRIQRLPNTIGLLSSLEELKLLPLHDSSIAISWLNYVPHGQFNFPAIKTMAAWLGIRTIAWLKDMKDLEGKLSIEGLHNMSNIVDAQRANLSNKCKLETLDLCWCRKNVYGNPQFMLEYLDLGLRLKLEACKGGLVGSNDLEFSLLECLQPHPNLKKLRVRYYSSDTLPGWMRDPFSLHSIQEIVLQRCNKIQSLPFSNLHTLKHLIIDGCSSIRVLQLEKLNSQLEELQISSCDRLLLITGLGDLDMLASLEIQFCGALNSLMMDRLQLVELAEPFDDSSHEKPNIGRQNISSLTSLEIIYCRSLRVLPDGLISNGTSSVRVIGCGFRNIMPLK